MKEGLIIGVMIVVLGLAMVGIVVIGLEIQYYDGTPPAWQASDWTEPEKE